MQAFGSSIVHDSRFSFLIVRCYSLKMPRKILKDTVWWSLISANIISWNAPSSLQSFNLFLFGPSNIYSSNVRRSSNHDIRFSNFSFGPLDVGIFLSNFLDFWIFKLLHIYGVLHFQVFNGWIFDGLIFNLLDGIVSRSSAHMNGHRSTRAELSFALIGQRIGQRDGLKSTAKSPCDCNRCECTYRARRISVCVALFSSFFFLSRSCVLSVPSSQYSNILDLQIATLHVNLQSHWTIHASSIQSSRCLPWNLKKYVINCDFVK